MAEVEYKGIKIGGSKLLLILPLIGTLGGGLWGGFELFTRYQSMEKKINSYAAPDLSGFDKRLSVLLKQMVSVRESVSESTDYTRDIKNNLKNDISRLEKQVDAAERRSKDAFKLVRESTDKNDSKVRKIKKALENPLANLRK